jgi:hypothetical protein
MYKNRYTTHNATPQRSFLDILLSKFIDTTGKRIAIAH